MLTNPVNTSDQVILEHLTRYRTETYAATIKRLGDDKIYVICPDCPVAEKVRFRDNGIAYSFDSSNLPYRLWTDLASYEETKKRKRLINKIKKTVESWDFGEEIKTEDLELIDKVLGENTQCT